MRLATIKYNGKEWRVLVKQLNQKFSYFTASVRRGWLNKS